MPCNVPVAYIRDPTKRRTANTTISVFVPPIPKYFSAKSMFPMNSLIGLLYLRSTKESGQQIKIGKKFIYTIVSQKNPQMGNFMVGEGGLEPPTSSLSVTRSNQLSYSPLL
jgi:hypothetical protein